MDFIRIDKLDPEPLYLQIARCIEQAYYDGRLKPGDLLPTERLLCDLYNFSSKVPVQAYRYLSDKGLVERVAGRGSYIQGKPAQRLPIFESLSYGQSSDDQFYTLLKETVTPANDIPITENKVGHRVVLSQSDRRGEFVSHLYYSLKHFNAFMRKDVTDLNPPELQKNYAHHTLISAVNLSDTETNILQVTPRAAAYRMEIYYHHNDQIVACEQRFIPANQIVWEDTLGEIRLH